jgi:hypothetical protein
MSDDALVAAFADTLVDFAAPSIAELADEVAASSAASVDVAGHTVNMTASADERVARFVTD